MILYIHGTVTIIKINQSINVLTDTFGAILSRVSSICENLIEIKAFGADADTISIIGALLAVRGTVLARLIGSLQVVATGCKSRVAITVQAGSCAIGVERASHAV